MAKTSSHNLHVFHESSIMSPDVCSPQKSQRTTTCPKQNTVAEMLRASSIRAGCQFVSKECLGKEKNSPINNQIQQATGKPRNSGCCGRGKIATIPGFFHRKLQLRGPQGDDAHGLARSERGGFSHGMRSNMIHDTRNGR